MPGRAKMDFGENDIAIKRPDEPLGVAGTGLVWALITAAQAGVSVLLTSSVPIDKEVDG
jgi:hypothetical protein